MARDDQGTCDCQSPCNSSHQGILGVRDVEKEEQEVKRLVQGHPAQGLQSQRSSIMAQVVSNVLEPSLVYIVSWTYLHLYYIINNGCN